MNAKRAAKLLEIARYYGEEKQVCKLMEELGEAVSAASEVLMLLSFTSRAAKSVIWRRGSSIWPPSWRTFSMSPNRLSPFSGWKLISRFRATRACRKP